MAGMNEFEHVTMTTREQWRTWLAENHARRDSIWLVTYKKASGKPHLPYDDIVEEALCFGWIDSHVRAFDTERSKLLLSPRKPGSPWSGLNKRRIEKLTKANLMTPHGMAKIQSAQADGTWTLYDDIETLTLPDDFILALDGNPAAKAHWENFSASSRKGILWWIKSAKKSETRQKRIEETVRLAADGVKANHP